VTLPEGIIFLADCEDKHDFSSDHEDDDEGHAPLDLW